MDKQRLKEIVAEDEILTLLYHLKKPSSKITLWQKLDSTRITQSASLVKVNLRNHEMEFFPRVGTFGFSSQLPLYFVSSNRLVIFKCSIKYNTNFKIVVTNPETLMLKDDRLYPRENYKEYKTAIQYGYGSNKNYILDHQLLKSKLLDLSSRGLAFKVSRNNIIKFRTGENIFIKTENMSNNDLINAKINYIQKHIETESKAEYYRVGVKFDEVHELNNA